jgi:hypothetical protein
MDSDLDRRRFEVVDAGLEEPWVEAADTGAN